MGSNPIILTTFLILIRVMTDTMYCFFHLTKTAGTTLTAMVHSFLRQTFLYENVVNNEQMYQPITQSEKTDSAKYFIGHLVYYGMHEDLKRPGKYIVFMRDPVTRIISLYHHHYIEYYRGAWLSPYMPLQEWIKTSQCRTMTESLLDCSKLPKTIEGAKEILKNTSFIGFQETFNTDVRHLFFKDVNIWYENSTELRAKHIKRSLTPITDDDIAAIKEIIIADTELYKYAEQLRADGHNDKFRLPLDG